MKLLPKAYKECGCGKPLTKRTRFGIKIEAPAFINTDKRWKKGKSSHYKTVVMYCCEECTLTIKTILKDAAFDSFFMYYPDTYPV